MLLDLDDLTEKENFTAGRNGFLHAMRLGRDALASSMLSKDADANERQVSMRMLTAYTLEGDTQDAEAGINAILSLHPLLQEWMKQDFFSNKTAYAIHGIIGRGTDAQRDQLRQVVAAVLRDPDLDTRTIAKVVGLPSDVVDAAAKFGSQILAFALESVGLPRSLINRWKRSEEKRATGVWQNITTIIDIEREAAGSAKALHSSFGVRYFGRYPASVLLRQYHEMRTQQPYGITMYPGLEDSRGVFYQNTQMFRQFDASLRSGLYAHTPLGLRVMEAQNKEEVGRRIPLLHRKYGEQHLLSFAVIGGHGAAGVLILGEGEPSDTYDPQDFEKKSFREGKHYFEKGATIILSSCRTGVLLAQRFSRAYPDVFVYAPIVNTYLNRIDRIAEKAGQQPLLLPTYGKGDLWVLYKGGKPVDCNAAGEDEETLNDKKKDEIRETWKAIGESSRPGFPLRRVEQTVFAKRLRSYATLLQSVYEKKEKSFRDIWPYINMIAQAAAHHIPTTRSTAAQLLSSNLEELVRIADDPASKEENQNEALTSLAYYAHCAAEQDKQKALASLDRYWGVIQKRIQRLEGPPAVVARFFSAQIQHGSDDARARVRESLGYLHGEIESANPSLADEFPSSRFMAYAGEIAGGLLFYHHEDIRRFAHEIIQRLLSGFNEQETNTLVDAWMNSNGDESDKKEMVKRHLSAAVQLESRHHGSVHSLFTEYGIRNFGAYPIYILRAEYVEGRESRLPHIMLLYPQKSITAYRELRDHYLMLWNRLNASLSNKGVRIRVAEWGDESDIARYIGVNAPGTENMQMVIIGSKGNSHEMVYRKGSRWRSVDESRLDKKQGRDTFAGLRDKTVILDMPCAGKWKRFAQILSEQEQCTVMAPYDSSRVSVIKPTMFHPRKIECEAIFGPAGVAVYRNGETVKG